MTDQTNKDLPPLPGWMSHYTIPTDDFNPGEDCYLDDRMKDYARAAVAAVAAALSASAPTTAPIEALSSECNECGGTGLRDLGGFYPWGEPTMIECDCISKMPTPNAPAAGSVPSEHALQSRWARIAASGEQYKAFVAEVRDLLTQYGAPQDNVGATPTGLVSMAVRMPDPAEHPRVLIYTEGVDFNGEQFFDVDAESLNECRFESPDDQPEVCRHASHWMPLPPAPQEGK